MGILTMENGDSYHGLWDNGIKKHFGKYTFSNGDVYMGQFANDKPNGHGKKEFSISGNIYEGNWIDGKGIGQGILIYKKTLKVLKGEFWDC